MSSSLMKIPQMETLVNRLDEAIEGYIRATLKSRRREVPFGNFKVTMVGNDYQVICKRTGEMLFVSVFQDTADCVAQAHANGDVATIKYMQRLERDYTKSDLEVMIHTHQYKASKAAQDELQRCVAEDRFYVARETRFKARRDMADYIKANRKSINTKKHAKGPR